jgi:hypothetical protein
MLFQSLFMLSMAHAAPIVAQGINSRRIAPGTAMTDNGGTLTKTIPTVNGKLVDGFGAIKIIRVGAVDGPLDNVFRTAALRSLKTESRMQNIGTINAVAGTVVEYGGKVGAKAAKNAIRAQSGFVADVAAGTASDIIEQQTEKAAEDIKGVRFDPAEGFRMKVVSATLNANAKADAEIKAKVTRKVSTKPFEKKKKDKTKKGKVIKKKDGKPKYFKAKCFKRSVNTKVVVSLVGKEESVLFTDQTTGIRTDSKCQKGSYDTDLGKVKARLQKPFALSKDVAAAAGAVLDNKLFPGAKSVRLNVGLTPTNGLAIRRLHASPALSMCLFEDGLKHNEADPGPNLGKGALLESHGLYAEAKKHYALAAVDPEYTSAHKAMVRIETRLIEVDIMKRAYGQSAPGLAFPHMKQCPTFNREGALIVTVDSKLRVDAGLLGEVLEPVWVGEQIHIVEDGKKWAKVALLDGTEGYLNKKRAFKKK